MTPRANTDDDVDFEPEDDLGTVGALQAKLNKLREELATVKKERQEFLDGWQRAKADAANTAREFSERLARATAGGREALAEEMLPVLDAFDMAMQGEAWEKLDANWRAGVEHVHATFLKVLESQGIRAFGKPGEAIDHIRHEAVGEASGPLHTVIRVLRRGYLSGERVLRPAHVIAGSGQS